MPVVLLDGFDELLQATGVSQTDYLKKVAAFQAREADQGRPVAVLVTSRTAVADRAQPVPGMVVFRIPPAGGAGRSSPSSARACQAPEPLVSLLVPAGEPVLGSGRFPAARLTDRPGRPSAGAGNRSERRATTLGMGYMPLDHLTARLDHVAGAVRAVLAGGDVHATAASAGLDPADLDDAVRTYHAAGVAAIEDRGTRRWHHVRVTFTDWNTSEHDMATILGPALDQLQASGTLSCWWFLRKHPHWRIRLLDADTDAVDDLLGKLAATGTITRWHPALYEPEKAAFGGPAGMAIAHELFCADSKNVLEYARHAAPPTGRRELSILLINAMMTAAGLDWFERGDVFHNVASTKQDELHLIQHCSP